MTYYAHTAEDPDGNPLPESSGKWQPLADHLPNAAEPNCSILSSVRP